MYIVGYLLAALAMYLLYLNELVVGGIIFLAGGVIASRLSLSVRSAGVLLMVISIAYGSHNGFDPLVLFLIFISFIMANFNSSRSSDGEDWDWGFDFDWSDLWSGDGFDGDGDGDGGGGD